MNILYLADPNSIHDIKWMSYFSKSHKCFLIARKEHLVNWDKERLKEFYNSYNIKVLGQVDDFSIKRFYNNRKEAKRIKKLIDKYSINVFHILYAEPNSLWALFRKKYNIPVIITTRGSDVLKGIQWFYERKDILALMMRYFYKKSFLSANVITSTSLYQTKRINSLFGRSDAEVVRTGVNIKLINKDTSSFFPNALPPDKPYVLFPRNMKPLFNHEFSIDAIFLLPDSIKHEYSFVFIDKDGSDLNYIKMIQGKMSKDNKISFVFLDRQPQSSVFELYRSAPLVVMNPLSDGSPVSAMEAMACKTPVILPPLNYDNDVFNNDTVTFFEEWTPESLALCIEKLLQPSPELDKKTNNAYDVVCKYGNYETEMQRLENIIRPLV